MSSVESPIDPDNRQNPYRTQSVRPYRELFPKPTKLRQPMKIPAFVYVIGASISFALAGSSCEYISIHSPQGHDSSMGMGFGGAFIIMGVYLVIRCFQSIPDNR
jgi:hypothetical protein